MPDQPPPIDYQALLRGAFRSVVREVLAQVAETGFPGAHHAFVTFRTDHPGVAVPEDLRREYPDEMTIVLQHRYEELEVDEEGFAVTLQFGGTPVRLRVPFAALTAYVDPAAELGLRLGDAPREGEEAPAAPATAADLVLPQNGPRDERGRVLPFGGGGRRPLDED